MRRAQGRLIYIKMLEYNFPVLTEYYTFIYIAVWSIVLYRSQYIADHKKTSLWIQEGSS